MQMTPYSLGTVPKQLTEKTKTKEHGTRWFPVKPLLELIAEIEDDQTNLYEHEGEIATREEMR